MPRQKVDPSREYALNTLRRTETALSFTKLLFEHSVEKALLPERGKAFAYQLVMGTLRFRGSLDWVLEKICSRPPEQLTPWIRNILRMGLYQILYLDKVPKSAAVDESVKLAKKYGHAGTAGLVNAVLRNAKRESILHRIESLADNISADAAAKYSHPTWVVELLVKDHGWDEAIRVMKNNNAIPPLTARTNTLRIARESVIARLKREEVRAEALPQVEEAIELFNVSNPSSLAAHADGLLYFQDPASMLAVHCLDVEPGQKVLDACAAPGGKTTHMAALMKNTGTIYALDVHDHRIALMEENAARLGACIIETDKVDATKPLPGRYREMDSVVADVPCTGLGAVRRRVDLKWRIQPPQIDKCVHLQERILQNASACVRSGGIFLYCTCTVTRAENEEVIGRFLHAHPDFRACPKPPAGAERYVTPEGYMRIMPGDENMDGFFIARMQRL